MTKSEIAEKNFMEGANCAQAIVMAFADECGITTETAERMASGFGGGMGRMRLVCGAVSGMVMVASLKYGSTVADGKDAKDAHYARIQQLANAFKNETGSLICGELLGLTPQAPVTNVSEPRTEKYYKKRPCSKMVALAAEILEKYIRENP